jgi:potassium-transporting ATPase potassium-binding subunit
VFGLGELLVLMGLLLAITKPLGSFMADVFSGKRTFLSPLLRPLERFVYRVCGVGEDREQNWTAYAASCLAFGLVNFLLFYALLRFQRYLPLNPQGMGTNHPPPGAIPMTPDLAFNTAVSFLTNTSWQSYAGEVTLSYLSQMLGIAVQSFTSAAAGMAVAVALIRGFARQETNRIGNFWVDTTRATLYILLPLSFLGALFLCSQGVIQTFRPYQPVTGLDGARQTIPLGPVASQEPIKLMSSDGGGFFNANSAHPFENPTPLTNLIEMFLILAIPAALTYTFGSMAGAKKHGWALFVAMALLFLLGCWVTTWSELAGNPGLNALGLDGRASTSNPGGNMEGKEVRFGIPDSAIFSVTSTASSDGAVNSAHDSFTPLANLVQMFNLKSGEVIFGGTGSGILSMILIAMITIFIAGLMVGRTPDYLGKKIEGKEIKMVMLAFVLTAAATLLFSAVPFVAKFQPNSYWNPSGPLTSNLTNPGPHGLSEILYANGSAVATNGSAMAGLNSNTPWFNLTLGLGMLIGRFLVIIPALAIAGSLARKRRMATTIGSMPMHGPMFVLLLLGTIFLVTALTYFPAFCLGPVAEHYLMRSGALFR